MTTTTLKGAALLCLLLILTLPVQGAASQQLSLAGIDRLDGSITAPPVSLQRWRQAVFEIRHLEARAAHWPAVRSVGQAVLASVPRHEIPLGLVHAEIDQVTGDGVRRDLPVFAFSPLRRTNYFPGNTNFRFASAATLTLNDTAEIVSMSFDAGDGNGFRPVRPDQTIPVIYPDGGLKLLKLTATLHDGSRLYARSMLEVIDGPSPPPPDFTWMITATQDWMGMAGSGQAYIYLAPGRTQLTNPVVVVEGFDIDNSIDWPVLYELLNRENLLEDLRAMGYDAVVLDFTEAVEPIQRNAFVLTRLIELVLGEIQPDQDMALIGASMGGLVSRYGLLWMEDQSIPHRVRNFISFDTPHEGANIPLGLQHWLSFFAGESEDAAFFLSRLNSDAARQMLLYHFGSTSGTTAAPDPLLGAFDSDLATLGDWPADTRLASIINGSGSMSGQGFNAGDQIIEWTYRSILVDIDGNVWSVPDGGSQVIFEGLIDPILLPAETETVTISGTLPWDNAPGGLRQTMDQIAEPQAPYGDIIALHGAHNFIPSISGLALDTTDPFYDIAGDPGLPGNVPFDAVYFPADNQEHILITPENKSWFVSEIGFGVPADVFLLDGFE